MNDNIIDIKVLAKDLATRVLEEVRNDLNGLSEEVDRAEKPANRFQRALTNIATVAGGIVSANVFGRLAGGVKDFFTNSVTATGNMEQLEIAFGTMLGSAEKAEKLLADIAQTAKTTPFELPQLQEAAKQLLAYGIQQEDIIPNLRAMGDIAAGIGSDKLPQLIRAFGQVRAKGRLMGGELLQIRETGLNLAEAMGITNEKMEEMVSNGEIGFEDVQKAFRNVTSEGGRFFNLMDKQSGSLQGIQSNIADTVNMMGVEILQNTGIFDMLKEGAKGVLQWLSDNKDEIQSFIMGIVDFAKEGMKSIGNIANFIGGVWAGIRPIVEPVVGFVVNVARTALNEAGKIFASIELKAQELHRTINQALGRTDEVAKAQRRINEISANQRINDQRGYLNALGVDTSKMSATDIERETLNRVGLKEYSTRFLAKGGDFVTNGAQLLMVGDNPGGRERVSVEPINSANPNGVGNGGKNINININNTQWADPISVSNEIAFRLNYIL